MENIARSLYLPRFYLPKLSELFSVVSKREERESCSLRGYCTSVQLNAYTVTQLWLVYYNSKPKLRNVLNLWIMQYFNIRIIFSEHPVACKYFCTPCSRSLYFGKFYIILMCAQGNEGCNHPIYCEIKINCRSSSWLH